MSHPNLPNLRLRNCCIRKLDLIRNEFSRARLLTNVAAIAPFAIAFGINSTGSIITSGTRTASLVISIASGDWNSLR